MKWLSATVRIKDVYTSFTSIADVVLKNVAELQFLSYIDMSGVIIVRRKQVMELIGNLKKKVDKASSKEEKRELIKEAGMKLNDMELEMVSGGTGQDFDMEYWQRYFQECEETWKESQQHQPSPHSKRDKGRLFR